MNRLLRLAWPLPGIAILMWYFPPIATALLYVVALVMPFSLAVLVHEGAHALTARLSGFQVTIFDTFPLSARLVDGKWRIRTSSLFGPAGIVGVAPTALPHSDFARRFRRMLIAGPLASLALLPLGVFAFWSSVAALFSQVGNPELQLGRAEVLPLILGTSLLGGTLAGAITLIPSRFGGMPSDGLTFRLLSVPGNANVIQRSMRPTALVLGVHRPREWTTDDYLHLRETVLEPTETPFQREQQHAAGVLMTMVLMDHGQLDEALTVTSFLVEPSLGLATVTDLQLQRLLVFHAFLSGSQGGAPHTVIHALLSRIPERSPVRRGSPSFFSTHAVVLAGEGRLAEAHRSATFGARLAKNTSRMVSTAVVEQDMAETVLAWLDREQAPATASHQALESQTRHAA